MITSDYPERRCHILHGFNVRDNGKTTVARLIPELTRNGIQCVQHKWGWRGLFGTWFFNKKLVDRLMEDMNDGDDVIGHSDGGNIAFWAAERGAKFRRMLMINPAIDNDKELPKQVELCVVFHDPKDLTVRVSAWIPFNRWGRGGATGLLSKDPRIVNIPHGYCHSGIFKTYDRYTKLGKLCARLLR